MSRPPAPQPVATDELLEQVERYVLDWCARGGENDAPLPYEQQPSEVQSAIALAAELKAKLA